MRAVKTAGGFAIGQSIESEREKRKEPNDEVPSVFSPSFLFLSNQWLAG